jgi:NADH-quinone oxidoreductase subunit F
MALGKFDRSGRRSPQPMVGSDFTVSADMVIAAVGQVPDLDYINGDGIAITKSRTIEVDKKTLATTREGVFAAGDNVRGPATVVEAVGDGKKAAMAVDRYLGGDGEAPKAFRDELLKLRVSYDEASYQNKLDRAALPHLPLPKRYRNFNEVVLGYQQKMAVEEAKRCLHCYIREEEPVQEPQEEDSE